jgi:hypothetical protein
MSRTQLSDPQVITSLCVWLRLASGVKTLGPGTGQALNQLADVLEPQAQRELPRQQLPEDRD